MAGCRNTFGCVVLMFLLGNLGGAAERDVAINGIAADFWNAGEPGFSLAVVHKGELVFKNGYGLADVKNVLPIEADSSFRLASVSKQFTGLCIAMLAERGKLSLDDDIRKHLKVPWEGVTIAHLVYHSSGIPDYIDLIYRKWKSDTRPRNTDGIRLLNQHKPKLRFVPGRKHEYSNSGYIMLASIIEKVSGQTLPAFMQANIFGPLEMTHTQVWTPKARIHKRVFGYSERKKAKTFRLDDEDLANDFYGDGGIYSTAEDMAKWALALRSPKLLK
ncbi:MAG: CubicO group peptidase (beta-lactamase class C family), partial [Rhodothermales bacterium]